MKELRAFITKLREEYGVPYPVSGQYLLTAPSDAFVQRVEWADDVAVAWRPHDEPKSEVRIRPDVRFGRPGASVAEVADDFDLTVRDVRWAVSYENAVRAA
ncbi:hypothetical protein [Amycolatopsis pithecellobii]|uniref:Uncharacterized protein n=1 Tax=Amycolatopsis pithecellobii TaxID=664692 RepID=A0A6N7YXW3_9PSEU|nr:hypothetical protein [Amycolatopsis pithecellobii]MTD56748.1 hypothetical protein [Amycolatopsis pithecellobii]